MKLNYCTFNLSSSCKIKNHGLCVASELRYAAVICLQCGFLGKSVFAQVMLAKSQVALLKQVSMSSLELCAAYLLAQLIAQRVQKERSRRNYKCF